MAHRRGGFSKKIDVVHWTYGSFGETGTAAGVVAQNVLSAQHLPETLLRIRGEWMTGISTQGAPARGTSVTLGLILVPEGTGTTVLWSPITDGDAPWIWWDVINVVHQEVVADVIAVQGMMSGRRVIDSKAMRKVRNTELQVVFESATLPSLTAVSVSWAGAVRVLAGS